MAAPDSKAEDDQANPKKNHLISRRKCREFVSAHPGTGKDAEAFRRWCSIVEKASWQKFSDVRATFGTASRVGEFVVFNIGGGKYRLVASIDYQDDKPSWVYIKHVLTHAEYDTDKWQKSS